MLPQNLQGLLNLHHLFIPSSTINENIIEKNQDEFLNARSKYIVRNGLKRIGCIAKAKTHYEIVVMAIMSMKSSLRDIGIIYSYLMISSP